MDREKQIPTEEEKALDEKRPEGHIRATRPKPMNSKTVDWKSRSAPWKSFTKGSRNSMG